MSGEPTDAQFLTCKAMEAHAVANQIDASYGNCIYIYIFSFFKGKRPGRLLLLHV